MEISIIICTYNRSDLLYKCIESVRKEVAGNDKYEVLVVDNDSPDNTKEIVESFFESFPNLRLHIQKEKNLSIARNNGLNLTTGDIVAYIDDDVIIDQKWKLSLERIINEHNPDVFGGPVFPYYIDEKPEWYNYDYELLNYTESFWFKNGKNPGRIIGANMIFKRSVLEQLGGFIENLGISPGKLTYGDDTYMVQRSIENGLRVFYDKDFHLLHYLPKYKMSLAYFYERLFQLGVSRFLMNHANFQTDYFTTEKDALFYINDEIAKMNSAYHLLLDEIKHNKINKYVENEIIEKVIYNNIYALGYLCEKSKYIKPKKNNFWQKIYRFNLETLVGVVRRIGRL